MKGIGPLLIVFLYAFVAFVPPNGMSKVPEMEMEFEVRQSAQSFKAEDFKGSETESASSEVRSAKDGDTS